MTRTYFDYAATTPMRDDVVAAMLPHFTSNGFNAGSAHAEGRAARTALDGARDSIAALLGARSREIIFTGSGSEADNLAIFGIARARMHEGRHLITSAVEHHAVTHAFDALKSEGFEVTVLAVDSDGRVAPEAFARALRPGTVLASIMLANNELGTLQPVAELAAIARRQGVSFHTDAVQAPGRIALDVDALGVDALALSAHKCYGPKGVGALYLRTGTPLQPLIHGGSQEAARRAGTENVAGIVGFARALELAVAELPVESARLQALRDRLEREILGAEPGARVNAANAPRLPNIASIAFPGTEAIALATRLDLDGAAVSTGSACASGSPEPSHVIAALGQPAWVERGTLRFSLGKPSSEQDVERLVRMLPEALRAVRGDEADLGIAKVGSPETDRAEVRF